MSPPVSRTLGYSWGQRDTLWGPLEFIGKRWQNVRTAFNNARKP
jgi:hypothetical protein